MLELAAASLTFDGFDDIDFVNTFQTARKAGYHNIEFNCWYPQTLTPQKMRELKKRCEQAQLHPIAIHVSSIAGGNREALTMNLCHKIYCIEAARELGCRRVCFTGTDRNSAGGIEDVITVLKLSLIHI